MRAVALDFLMVGTPSWEVVARVATPPETLLGPLSRALPLLQGALESRTGVGGSAAVTGAHLACRGFRVGLLGTFGDDPPGQSVAEFLARRGLLPLCSPRPGRSTKRTAVLVHPETGTTAFFADLPRGMAPPPLLADLPSEQMTPETWIHLDHLPPLAEALASGRWAGLSLDVHDPPRRPTTMARFRRLLPHLSLVQVREEALGELARGVGVEPAANRPPGALAANLAARGPWVVVTQGARGALWASPAGETGLVPPVPRPGIVDPTGAGDAFAAVVLEGLRSGHPPSLSAMEAAREAARACRSLGPWPRPPCRWGLPGEQ